jgi:hypothetical protein
VISIIGATTSAEPDTVRIPRGTVEALQSEVVRAMLWLAECPAPAAGTYADALQSRLLDLDAEIARHDRLRAVWGPSGCRPVAPTACQAGEAG